MHTYCECRHGDDGSHQGLATRVPPLIICTRISPYSHRATRASNAPDAASAATLVPALENYAQALEPLQLAGAGDIATSLARGIVHVASLIGDHVWAIPSLLRVFDAFRSVNGGTHNLTTMHAIVVYQCLRTAHYHVAYDWAVQYDIVSADSSASPLAYTDVLEYFYYAGLVCTKIDDLERAADLFEQVRVRVRVGHATIAAMIRSSDFILRAVLWNSASALQLKLSLPSRSMRIKSYCWFSCSKMAR